MLQMKKMMKIVQKQTGDIKGFINIRDDKTGLKLKRSFFLRTQDGNVFIFRRGNVQNVKYKKITREMVKNGGDSGAGSILINNVEARTARCCTRMWQHISQARAVV